MNQPTAPARVVRTAVQVVLALCGAIPAAIALLPIRPETAVWVCGIAGAIFVLVSAMWNAIEEVTGKTVGAPKD